MSLWLEMVAGEYAHKTIETGGMRTRYRKAESTDASAVVYIEIVLGTTPIPPQQYVMN
jgi:hypothetical protein